ncbi:MAG: hypothetical protein ACK5ZR_00405 [Gemmatimonadaceae bacterium]
MTTAARIAAELGNGTEWHTPDGFSFDDLVDAEHPHVERRDAEPGDHATRYTFADGSAITVAGAAWDIGFPTCYCWQGVGHTAPCPLA